VVEHLPSKSRLPLSKEEVYMRKTYVAVVVILFLSCLIGGWLTVWSDLRTTQIINEQLIAENTQYASDLNGANESSYC